MVKPVPYDRTKRVIDILGSLGLLILLSPLLLVAVALIRITSPGPALFRQRRLAQGGKEFVILKFRSMREDAEAATGPVWAQEGDNRITPIGHFIRLTRIDELPQLLNVLRGEMSLIGPRPERPEFCAQLEQEIPDFPKRLAVKPGITGLAQVTSGYVATSAGYQRKVELDIFYIENRSLMLDLKIALKTLLVVLTGSGAR